jgi:hypothetical protein
MHRPLEEGHQDLWPDLPAAQTTIRERRSGLCGQACLEHDMEISYSVGRLSPAVIISADRAVSNGLFTGLVCLMMSGLLIASCWCLQVDHLLRRTVFNFCSLCTAMPSNDHRLTFESCWNLVR